VSDVPNRYRVHYETYEVIIADSPREAFEIAMEDFDNPLSVVEVETDKYIWDINDGFTG
jgi:hypothetical protein